MWSQEKIDHSIVQEYHLLINLKQTFQLKSKTKMKYSLRLQIHQEILLNSLKIEYTQYQFKIIVILLQFQFIRLIIKMPIILKFNHIQISLQYLVHLAINAQKFQQLYYINDPQNLLKQRVKFSIIGDNMEKIVLLSDNIEIKNKRSYFIIENQETIVNISKENIAYGGISAQTVKAIVLDAVIFINYINKESSITAADDFIKVAPITKFQSNYQKIVFSSDLMKRQLIFLKLEETVIDKDLGNGEQIIVQKHSILGMQDFVLQTKGQYQNNVYWVRQIIKIRLWLKTKIILQFSYPFNSNKNRQQQIEIKLTNQIYQVEFF
ncbi:unnamed protein product [Paramecium pentaurelia]|uniref:Uncharacterized protein n=1 Tax=Paramecium pentaurelia TaxID=43138 RepID=A0A8S1Y2E3_9CILI|nr:unnamed protein product [Paramecium pentaurelia]